MRTISVSTVVRWSLFVAAIAVGGWAQSVHAEEYDPLKVDSASIEPMELSVKDSKRSREIPLRVYLSTKTTPAAVVLFSHGLGGNNAGSSFLGKHWAARGYVAVFVQHPGSDDSLWKNAEVGDKLSKLKGGASIENFLLRAQDIPAVLDQLDAWNTLESHQLKGRLDMKRVGMSGHSFGAVTTQAVSGQKFRIGDGYTDPRIKAACILSPSAPKAGSAKTAFADVSIPWLLLTGTHDNVMVFGLDAKSRLQVFPALPAGDKYELVLDKAEHSFCVERSLPGETLPRNPNHHRAVMAVSTAFWDAYLLENGAAKTWLQSDSAVRSVLEKDDRWQKK